ncbi:pilus assembly protein [Bosea sp. BK604]|uniref:vWA domain-containing protein n=1 Tax=Bosea sp. BK604 TaxID=2512180 RepID=UPI0010526655|nr:pilus assembly protein [Bosea sp. BK604]TCR70598.1 Flp pilus assembly protein TadG [Bosea sp. BK604]
MSLLARFGKDKSGNVALMFGLAIIPVLGLAGAAVDYGRASSARTALSNAIDSAALMAARDAQKLSDADLRSRTEKWVRSTLENNERATLENVTVDINRTSRTVSISAKANLPASMTKIIGEDTLEVASSTQSTWGTNTIELALVLDNTGSMASSGKMAALKQASLDLLKVMQQASTETDQIRVSIVPFATEVRLDAKTYGDADWLRYGVKKRNSNQSASKSSWQGCVMDRDDPYDSSDAGIVPKDKSTLYPAVICEQSTLARIQPLTSNWTALTNTINSMTPVGNTNVTIGAAWGLATLTPGTPLTEAAPATTPRLTKYMILLTDGDNTENRFGDNQNGIDNRTKLACQSAKTAGVNVYTVRVIEGNRNLLRGCASKTDMYYEVNNASQLGPVFKNIANQISQVRLTT